MKKFVLFLMVFVLSMNSVAWASSDPISLSNTFDEMTSEQFAYYTDLATSTVERYYEISMSTKTVLSSQEESKRTEENQVLSEATHQAIAQLPLESGIRELVTAKMNYESLYRYQADYSTAYIDGSYEVIEWKADDDILVLKIATLVRYQYSDYDTASLMGREEYVAIRDPQSPVIFDWYNTEPSGFDSLIRGEGLDLFDAQNLISDEDILQLQQEVRSITESTFEAYKQVAVYKKW